MKFSRTPQGRHLEYLKTGKHREQARRNFLAQTYPELIIWTRARRRAREEKVDFTIIPPDIHIPLRCPYLQIPLLAPCNGTIKDNSPSLDRINPCIGYVETNIQVISYKANKMKNNATPQELRLFAKYILKK